MHTSNKPKHLFVATLVCLVASSFYFYDFLIRVIPAAFSSQLMTAFNIHAAGLSTLASAFFWGYALMQIPCGMIYDRFSPPKVLTITVFFSALATLGFTFTNTFVLATFYRFIMGLMTSFAFVGALVVGAHWFRGKNFAAYTGFVQLIGCLGAIFGISPIILLSQQIGWQHSILAIAIFGFALALLMWLTLKEAPTKEHLATQDTMRIGKAYRYAFKFSQTWWIALYGFAIWSPVSIFATLWGVPYFTDPFYQFSDVDAGNLVSTIWWTIAIAGPTVGFLSNYFKTRKIPMFICTIIGVASSITILFSPTKSYLTLTILLIGYGIASSSLVIPFGLIVDLYRRKTVGAITGFVNMAVISGGVLLLPTVGFLIQHFWLGNMQNGAPLYQHENYQKSLLVIPACFLLAFICAFFIKETHCEKTHKY